MYFKQIMRFLRHLVNSTIKHNIGALAAALAFFGFSAMIPLILLLIYGTSLLIPNVQIQGFLSDVLQSYVPNLPDAKLYLTQNIARLAQLGSKVGIFALIGFLWTTVGGFVSFQQILDVIWENNNRRSFIRQYLVGFGMLGILLTLTVISSLTSMVSVTLMENVFPKGNMASWLALIHSVSRISFPLLLFLTCYFCYRFLPSRTSRSFYLAIGAFLSTLAIYASREIFVWYTESLDQYELVYGSLTFIMLFTFWIYIVSVIVLFGAEIALSLKAIRER